MRTVHFSIRVLTAVAVVAAFAACGGGEATPNADSAAAAAAAPPPAPDAFTLVAKDGSWSGDISAAGIVYRPKGKDSLTFEFKAPTVTGAIADYDALMVGKDTIRMTISLATASCSDSKGGTYTHMAQVWLTGRQGGRDVNTQSQGCANKK